MINDSSKKKDTMSLYTTVYLPVSWTGKRVKVLLLDPVEKESDK
jgi:hypothetical protein